MFGNRCTRILRQALEVLWLYERPYECLTDTVSTGATYSHAAADTGFKGGGGGRGRGLGLKR